MSKNHNKVTPFNLGQALGAKLVSAELAALFKEYLGIRLDGRVASFKTQKERELAIRKIFKILDELGVKNIFPKNLKQHHIKMVIAVLESKLGPSSLQNLFTHMKALYTWIGKKDIVGKLADYLEDPSKGKRIYSATRDKSWDNMEDGDKEEILQRISKYDFYVGVQVIAQDVIGLRKKEAICFKPHQDVIDGVLYVRRGAKGGRQRSFSLSADQLALIEWVKHQLPDVNAHLGDPSKTLKQNMARYSNVLYRLNIKQRGFGALGITGHGLRAGVAIRAYKSLGGSLPILGEPISSLSPEEDKAARLKVAEYLGHSRISVTAAYYGPATLRGLTKLSKNVKEQLITKVLALTQGATYAFATKAFTTPDQVKVPARNVTGIYTETVQIGDHYYLRIVDAYNAEPENINVDYLDSVKLVKLA